MAKLLRMEMPGKSADENIQEIIDESDLELEEDSSSSSSSAQKSQYLSNTSFNNEMGSKSLLANVLNKNDEFGIVNFSKDVTKTKSNKTLKPKLKNGHIYFKDESEQAFLMRENTFPQSGYERLDEICLNGQNKSEYILVKRSLNMILKELRSITQKIKDDEDYEAISLSWKFSAMVIDRLCMLFFAFATFISTAGILFTSPNLYKSSDPDPKF